MILIMFHQLGDPDEGDIDDEGVAKGERGRGRGESGDGSTLSLVISRVAGPGTDQGVNGVDVNSTSSDGRAAKNAAAFVEGDRREVLRKKEGKEEGNEEGKRQRQAGEGGRGGGDGGKEERDGVILSTSSMSGANGDSYMDVVDDNHSSHSNGRDDKGGKGGGGDKMGESEKENEREKMREKEKGVWVVEPDQFEVGEDMVHDTIQKAEGGEVPKQYYSPADIMKRIGEEMITDQLDFNHLNQNNSKLHNGHEISLMASRLPPLDPLISGRDNLAGWKRNISTTAIKSAFKKIKIRKLLPTGKIGSIFGAEY